MTKRRKLTADEAELWKKVTDKTEPLRQLDTFDPTAFAPKPKEKKPAPRKVVPLDGKSPPKPPARKVSFDLSPSLPEQLRSAPVQMDRKTFGRMQRGKLKPEARIDLHGLTLDRAHGALTKFILSSHGGGKRLVLVITGKGKERDDGGPIPVRFGVLRHQVPQWLGQAPLKSIVMQVTPAHVSHGGGGAYYVYLRRQR